MGIKKTGEQSGDRVQLFSVLNCLMLAVINLNKNIENSKSNKTHDCAKNLKGLSCQIAMGSFRFGIRIPSLIWIFLTVFEKRTFTKTLPILKI